MKHAKEFVVIVLEEMDHDTTWIGLSRILENQFKACQDDALDNYKERIDNLQRLNDNQRKQLEDLSGFSN